jgi:hypothetical protein
VKHIYLTATESCEHRLEEIRTRLSTLNKIAAERFFYELV